MASCDIAAGSGNPNRTWPLTRLRQCCQAAKSLCRNRRRWADRSSAVNLRVRLLEDRFQMVTTELVSVACCLLATETRCECVFPTELVSVACCLSASVHVRQPLRKACFADDP